MGNIAVSGGLPATGKTYTRRAGWVWMSMSARTSERRGKMKRSSYHNTWRTPNEARLSAARALADDARLRGDGQQTAIVWDLAIDILLSRTLREMRKNQDPLRRAVERTGLARAVRDGMEQNRHDAQLLSGGRAGGAE